MVDAKHLLFLCGGGLQSSLGFEFKGLPIGVDCDDELMIEVVMVCAVLVLEGGNDAIFFLLSMSTFGLPMSTFLL